MAWRWSHEPNPEYKEKSFTSLLLTGPNDNTPRYVASKTYGYCGMAGSL
jgi:hypothetical protein